MMLLSDEELHFTKHVAKVLKQLAAEHGVKLSPSDYEMMRHHLESILIHRKGEFA